jgi:nitrite transporter NirC
VIIAGAELFTGNNMVMAVGLLRRTVSPWALLGVWLVSFAGNLAGSLALAWLVTRSGVLGAHPQLGVIEKAVAAKMQLSFGSLFYRGVLCNWLVCLAVWSALRMQSEAGKLIMIFWCLFAFVGAGFEHSVANMTLLALGLMQAHGPAVTLAGFVHNLVPVTLGNIAGGALFVGGAYWLAGTPLRLPRRVAARMLIGAEVAAGD